MSKKLTTKEFINRARRIHNFKYDYNKVIYVNAHENITIICPVHGEFLQRPNGHLNGKGCLECSGKKQLTTEKFVKKAQLVHGNKYDYSKVIYINAHIEVTIICPVHGEFLQSPNAHLDQKQGCPKCGNIAKGLKHRNTTDFFIETAKKVHDNRYDYSGVIYIKNRIEVAIICSVHGEFLQKPHSHLRGSGCPVCQKSKGEIKISKILDNKNIKYIKQKRFKDCINPKTKYPLPYDFYLPQQNTLIEFNGQQHYINNGHWHTNKYTFADQQYRDSLKQQYALYNGYKYLIIKYNDKNIEEKLNNICC